VMSSPGATPLTHFAPPERLPPEAIAREVAEMDQLGTLIPVLDSMPDVVMILNRQRQILFGNKALRDFADARQCACFEGLRPGELLNCQQAATAPQGCGTGEACRTCGAVNAILAGLAGKSARHECHISTPLNDALDLRIFASPFHWHGCDYVLVVASDISDQKRRQVLERIFFHDILNTAGGIQGLAELIATDTSSADSLSPILRASAESLVHEIKSQRLLLAAENRELQVTPAPLAALAELEAVASFYRHHSVAEGKTVTIDPGTADFAFLCDAAILQRVLGNLLKNALEASRPGDAVSLGAKSSPEEYVFWCHNPGCIPRDAQLQIFHRSFTTKGDGRGVGTYGVKLLTDRYLGGRVSFTSTPGDGTRFLITLPVLSA
ncbi:MAG: ATP-binding protein, partial [Opitutales bacterium]